MGRSRAAVGTVVAFAALAAALGAPHPSAPQVPVAAITLSSATTQAAPSVTRAALLAPRKQRKPRRTATLVMGGDLLWHNTVWESAAEDHARTGRGTAYDFDPMFADVR
ncbi:MAG: hypothetical protein QOD98_3018, partial [Nocardioidaceae bacterium]|nr:hypothetical protein [Nocardioidaceae bacterium]